MKTAVAKAPPALPAKVGAAEAVAMLKRRATKATRAGLAKYGIPSQRAFGVAVRDIQSIAKALGKHHELALALWRTEWYEARMLAAYVDDPAAVTASQMEQWCRDFDSWAICDTVCFVLFDRTKHAWSMLAKWAGRREEFVRRAAFALLWGLSVHDKSSDDAVFFKGLGLIERAATDERRMVQKAVSMALRATGKRNPTLRAAAAETTMRLAASSHATARWIAKDALRELAKGGPARSKAVAHG